MIPTHSNSDISEQSSVGVKRELDTSMEGLEFLIYIFLLYIPAAISKVQHVLASLMSQCRTSMQKDTLVFLFLQGVQSVPV